MGKDGLKGGRVVMGVGNNFGGILTYTYISPGSEVRICMKLREVSLRAGEEDRELD